MSYTAGTRQEELLQRDLWCFVLHSFGAFGGLLLVSGQCGGCWGGRESGFQHLESEAAHALNFPLFLTSSVSVSTLNFSSLFFFLSMIHILLADGFVCFMPQREPSCTDLLPSSQFLELAWSSHPSRTTGPDEELQSLRLAAIRHGASVPRHLDRLPLLSSWVFLWNKGKLPEGGIHHSFGPGR